MSIHALTSAASRASSVASSAKHRPTLAGAAGSIAALVLAMADPGVEAPIGSVERTRAMSGCRAARKRVRADHARSVADEIIRRAGELRLDLRGIATAPEVLRPRLVAAAVAAIQIAADEEVTSPLGRLRVALGRRLVAVGEALLDRTVSGASIDRDDARSAGYAIDRGLAIIRGAIEDERARAARPSTSPELEARIVEVIARRARAAAEHAHESDAGDGGAGDGRPSLACANAGAPAPPSPPPERRPGPASAQTRTR